LEIISKLTNEDTKIIYGQMSVINNNA